MARAPRTTQPDSTRADLRTRAAVSRAQRARPVTLATCHFVDEASDVPWGRLTRGPQAPVPHPQGQDSATTDHSRDPA